MAQMVKNPPAMQESQARCLSQEAPLETEWQATPVFLPGKSMDRGAWQAIVHRVTASDMTE